MWKVRCVLDTVCYDRICQWIVAGQRSTWYSLIWYNLSVNCCRSEVYLIHLYVIEFVSELWQIRGVLDIVWYDRICQWIVAGWRCTWYIFMWWSLSVNITFISVSKPHTHLLYIWRHFTTIFYIFNHVLIAITNTQNISFYRYNVPTHLLPLRLNVKHR